MTTSKKRGANKTSKGVKAATGKRGGEVGRATITVTTVDKDDLPKFGEFTALALSGGGAKGSFQIGALRYLFERVFGKSEHTPLPTIITGTSVGAVNAVKLAEGGGMASFRELEKIWQGLRRDEDMYLPQPWFATLDPVVKEAINIAAGRGDYDPADLFKIFILKETHIFDSPFVGVPVSAIERAIAEMKVAQSIYHLGPIAQLMKSGALDVAKVASSGVTLRLAVVSLETGKLRYVTQKGHLLERDLSRARWLGAAPVSSEVPPQCSEIADTLALLNEEKEALQMELAGQAGGGEGSPPAGLRSLILGELAVLNRNIARLKARLEECRKRFAASLPATVSLSDAVLASAAIPAVFQPIRLLDETYVDGGVREILPIQVAIDSGAAKVYAIGCSPTGVPLQKTLGAIPDIALRALSVGLDEVLLNEVTRTSLWKDKPVFVIQPGFEVHDALTIKRGLIRISMSYGYMRAADRIECLNVKNEYNEQAINEAMHYSDKITRLRKMNFEDEERYYIALISTSLAPGPPKKALELADKIRERKEVIRKLAIRRLKNNLSLSPGIERAWLNWEYRALEDLVPKAGMPFTSSVGYGLLVKVSMQDKNTYIIYGGSKLKLRNSGGQDAMTEMGYKDAHVYDLPSPIFNSLPEDRPGDGTLLRSKASSVIYIMRDGKRCSLTPPVIEKHKLSLFEVRVLPKATLNAIPEGPAFT